MTLDRAVMMFAGFMVLLSLALGYFVSPWWFLLNAFVGLNLMQASMTGFCPAAIVFANSASSRVARSNNKDKRLSLFSMRLQPFGAAAGELWSHASSHYPLYSSLCRGGARSCIDGPCRRVSGANPVTIPEMKAVFGRVESRIVVPARARIGGVVEDVAVSEGDYVTKGDAIALVVDDKIALELKAADARFEALNSQLENARLELARAQQLRSSGTGTQARLDQAQTQFDVVTNQVAAAVAEKAVVEQRAKEGEVLAPATGRVLTVPVTLGSVVMAGENVARVAPGPYYLRLSLPERHAAEIVEGAEVVVGERGLAPGSDDLATVHTGQITKVYPEIAEAG